MPTGTGAGLAAEAKQAAGDKRTRRLDSRNRGDRCGGIPGQRSECLGEIINGRKTGAVPAKTAVNEDVMTFANPRMLRAR